MWADVEICRVEGESVVDESVCQPVEGDQAEVSSRHYVVRSSNQFQINPIYFDSLYAIIWSCFRKFRVTNIVIIVMMRLKFLIYI